MPAPIADIDICNLALDELKQPPINSIVAPVQNTEFICKRWYDQSRREALRAHPWKFATIRKILTPDPSATPPFGYAYAYNLPDDYIRLVTLGDDYLADFPRDFEIENNQILAPSGSVTTDSTSLDIRYVRDYTQVGKMDPLFIKYFVLKMAVSMSNKFSISRQTKTDLKEDFKDIEMEAKAVNGQDRKPKRIQVSRILTKRRGLPGGVFAGKTTDFSS